MNNGSKYGYLAKNTVLFTISSFGSKILVFLLVPLYTSILSTSDYGIADLITTTATLLIYVFTINIADSVLRFAIDQKTEQESYLSYGLKVLFSGSLIFGIIILVMWKGQILDWKDYCYLFLFIQFFSTAVYQIASNYLRAIDDIKGVAISGIVTTAVTVLLNILFLIIWRTGVVGYLASMALGPFVATLYCFFRIGKPIFYILKKNPSKKIRKAMRGYSIPLIFNGVAWWMNNSIDKYFVTAICGAAQNGIYAVSYKIPTILTVFHSIFSQAWNLSAIKEFDKNDKDGFFANTYTMYNAILVILCSGLVLFNIPIAKILFAKDFFVAWKYSSVLLVSIVFSALSGFLGSIFTAVKDSKIFAVSTVISAIVNCILNAILIPMWGIQGAAIATAISFFLIWLIRLICTRKYIKWRINLVVDIVAYVILVIQVVLEHFENHNYVGQIICLIILLLLYRKQFLSSMTLIINKFTKRRV